MLQLSGKTVCAAREIQQPGSALEVLDKLRADPYPWLLDSALPSELGRFSFAGADPYLVARRLGGQMEVECLRAVRPGLTTGRHVVEGDPLEIARQLLPEPPAQSALTRKNSPPGMPSG